MINFDFFLLAVLLITATITDVRDRKIPNWLTFSAAIAAIARHAMNSGIEGLLFSIIGLFAGMSVFLIIYILGGMGAGDVKLMGAVGAVLGPYGVLYALFCTAVVGGIYAIFVFASNRDYLKRVLSQWMTSLNLYIETGHILRPLPIDMQIKKPVLHYGLAIAIGTFISIALAASGYHLVKI